MSANLCWAPARRLPNYLPYELKVILQAKHGLDGRSIYTHEQTYYLQGLADAGIDGAQELIHAIDQYGQVEVWLEY
jgi:hypothetical protein